MEVAKGKKVRVRKLVREDVDKMQRWSMHQDPLFFHYNFPKMNEAEKDEWYAIKTKTFRKKSFAIENLTKEVIGYLSIRDIKWLKRESELGIVLDPQHINKGYGTEAIRIFLEYYFNELNMTAMTLRAAKFNERAIKCYMQCGFRVLKESDEEFEDQYAEIFYNPLYKDLRKLFTIVEGKKKTRYVHMQVKKVEFYGENNHLSTKTVKIVE
ncbi:GNAT family N-acetyltransferase [Clostridiaceae bacterium 35-E11]